MWGLAFSSVECTLVGLRKKEDPFNSIMAGGVAGGLLTLHSLNFINFIDFYQF